MRWEDYRQSDNVEDVRDSNDQGSPNLPIGRATGGIGIGGLLILGVLYFGFGIDPRAVLNTGLLGNGPGPSQPQVQAQRPDQNDRLARFVSVTLATTEDVWDQIFKEQQRTYERPKLRIFTGETASGCGEAEKAMGPFYCPADRYVYLDMSFFNELATRFGSPGEFANAYVIGHEVGHHVQNLLGILPKVTQMQRQNPEQKNALQVRVELQADCFAGVWANRAQRIKADLVEQGDIEKALHAAAAIGDDTLQRQARGYVVPESFTHGTSEQRVRWFKTGYTTGQISACNTFQANPL